MLLEEGKRMLLGLHEEHEGVDGSRILIQKCPRSVSFEKRDPAKVFNIGMTLGPENEEMLIQVLQEYLDIFAWDLRI
ncbi:hypothetical protein LIER_16753 [Lithospermum erythrorhizon]|uniref:Uncharacterized protein n=1 Tax=Lithospermum erythrorhizon TaxID=34254 RepID=A0AAV3QCA0_LITER